MNHEEQARSWHLRLLGGMERAGRWQVPADTVALSLVGGVRMVVPRQMNVVVTGFNLVGGTHVQPGVSADGAPTLRINAFGIFGGIDVQRSD